MKSTDIKKVFKKFKVLTLGQVSKTLKRSTRTIQRQFAEMEVLRSYNKNSRYYTLSNIPEFNSFGIWGWHDIFFSRYGNLRQTVMHLILTSEDGLNGNEIGDILNLLPRSFMHHFRELEGILREKHGGVYVYFSSNPQVYAKQRLKRVQALNTQKFSDAVAVQIFVGYIKHPELSAEELSILLRREKGCDIPPAVITNLLSIHDLLKKTPDSRR